MTRDSSKMGPSELLAALAHRLYEWGEAGRIESNWLAEAEAILIAAPPAPDESGAPGLAMKMARGRAALSAAATLDVTFQLFLQTLIALQALDAWHAPLRLADRFGIDLDAEYEEALERLQFDGGAYNAPGPFGSIIPPAASHNKATSDDASVVARILHETAYLPPSIAAGDPDNPAAVTDRVVELKFVAPSVRTQGGRPTFDGHPVIAIAPVLQELDDADLDLRKNPERYGVKILYDPARLGQIVTSAIATKAHLLFMPEMAVDARMVPELASAIRRAAAAHCRGTGAWPNLRFVMAGVSHPKGGNSIVLLDIEGNVILEQEKLCRWNLSPEYQYAYGVRPACTVGAPALCEDIAGGKTVFISDLEQFGRFLTLICADMDYDKPGDWLIRNVAIDWLHAPIMDRSIAWSVDKAGDFHPWIVARAHRAITLGVPKVIVTNSMFLTLRSNVTHSAKGSRYPVVRSCAISFMLDKTDAPLTYRQVTVDLPCPLLQVPSFKWGDAFEPFPPSRLFVNA